MNWTKNQRELVTYVLFGALTTLVNWVTYFGLTTLFQAEGYTADSAERLLILNASQLVAWVISVVFAFVTNKRYVFRSSTARSGMWRELVTFASARVLSYLLFDLVLYNLFVFRLGVGHAITKVVMNVLVVVFNYFASKYVVFRARSSKPPEGKD